jgi:isopentenyl-diphosphate delta-isomerase
MDALLKARKDHHLDIVLHGNVESPPPALGFGRWTLAFDALPELALGDVDVSTTLLGKRLRAPIVIGAMTGGTDRAGEVNAILARAAARVGVGMALGSQRPMYRFPETTASFDVRRTAPDLPLLFGNFGAVQLNTGVTVEDLARVADAVGADALNLHLNVLQEAIQPEGDTDFRGLTQKIGEVAAALRVPVVVKEVGCGLSARVADRLATLPIAGVEVAGAGGTSWAAVESYRAGEGARRARIGRSLAGFGMPTMESLFAVRPRIAPPRVVLASGGVRSGMDVAVALAAGADAVCVARPLLEAATQGEDAVVEWLETLILELRILMFCAGAADLGALRSVERIDAKARGWV